MDILGTIFTGVCNGIGTGVGSYIATKYAVSHMQRIEEEVRKRAQQGNLAIAKIPSPLHGKKEE